MEEIYILSLFIFGYNISGFVKIFKMFQVPSGRIYSSCKTTDKDDNIHRSLAKNSLKITSIQNPSPIPASFTPQHQKWLPYQILGGETVKNVQTDLQTTEI